MILRSVLQLDLPLAVLTLQLFLEVMFLLLDLIFALIVKEIWVACLLFQRLLMSLLP